MLARLAVLTILLAPATSAPYHGAKTPSTAQRDKAPQNPQAPIQLSNDPKPPDVVFFNNERAADKPWYAEPGWWLFALGIPSLFFVGYQSILFRKSVGAAVTSAQAANDQLRAIKNRERPRLSIVLNPPKVAREATGSKTQGLIVFVSIYNQGPSKALQVKVSALAEIVDVPEGHNFVSGFQHQVPETIANTDEGTPIVIEINNGVMNRAAPPILTSVTVIHGTAISRNANGSIKLSIPDFHRLRNGDLHLQVGGLIQYQDTYGDAHETPFRYVWWSAGTSPSSEWGADSCWINHSGHPT